MQLEQVYVLLSDETIVLANKLKKQLALSLDDAVRQALESYVDDQKASEPAGKAETDSSPSTHICHYSLFGDLYEASTAKEVLINVLKEFSKRDKTFLERIAADYTGRLGVRGRKRPVFARKREDLYPDFPALARFGFRLNRDWYVDTNNSGETKMEILGTACKIFGVTYGTELRVNF